ncbi:glycosyl transferase, putative [Lunatimonas lonarensis]|uniref:Glycosyl transferase, putative n=1 Tax=Lunatimonas lonarensis TaxID=1232681 RepID=R7ZYZ8_9BACT|nr:glycosyltransferase [Lunatimonas lonarensis]EON79310.1 glycosyl transferase, putative [Lunatimonas lonarensis]
MISLVIPHFKDVKRLIFLLNHLNHQALEKKKLEVIVVNNDPDIPLMLPDTLTVTYSLSVLEEPKPGSYAARNKGIEAARGEIIAFTDSDMLPDSRWLEIALGCFLTDKSKEIGILTGPVPLFFKDPNHLTPAEIYEKYTGFDFEGYAREGACGAGNWFSYKSVLEEFGRFREDLKSNGDTELSLRISQKYKVIYVPELINRHPARFTIDELVFRYQRILGGAYTRKFQGNKIGFFLHTINFIFRRFRFSIKKFFTVPMAESWAIFKVCNALSWGAAIEYFRLIMEGGGKR